MAISYPLSIPGGQFIREVRFGSMSTVGVSASPFTGQQQVYAHQGEWWTMAVTLRPMRRADAEEWAGFFLALNGREGTFLFGDPVNTTPRGTWAGSTVTVLGGSQTGKTLVVTGVTAGLTALAGDWFQLSSGSGTRLHKVTQDATSLGSPDELTLEIWPRLRSSPSNGDAVTIASPVGIWRMASNSNEWSIGLAQSYSFTFSAVEAL